MNSPERGSTPIKNWSRILAIELRLTGDLYRCHLRCGDFLPGGLSFSLALRLPAIRLRSCTATISLPPVVLVCRGWGSSQLKLKYSYLRSWTRAETSELRDTGDCPHKAGFEVPARSASIAASPRDLAPQFH